MEVTEFMRKMGYVINKIDGTINETISLTSTEKGKTTKLKSGRNYSKNIELKSIHGENSDLWLRNEVNPDFKLITIHAANEGFQSKMCSVTGSYVVTSFTEKLRENIIDNNNKRFLFEICSDIQTELHNKGKQHTVNTFNDNTQYIKFLENKDKGSCDDDVEYKLSKIDEVKEIENEDEINKGRTNNEIELTDMRNINKLDLNDQRESEIESDGDGLKAAEGISGNWKFSHQRVRTMSENQSLYT